MMKDVIVHINEGKLLQVYTAENVLERNVVHISSKDRAPIQSQAQSLFQYLESLDLCVFCLSPKLTSSEPITLLRSYPAQEP